MSKDYKILNEITNGKIDNFDNHKEYLGVY